MSIRPAAFVLAALAAAPAMACYTVYDRTNTVVYNAQTPPVDMRLPLHEALEARGWPGGHMVFGNDGECPRLNAMRRQIQQASTTGRSPLLTDAATAQKMGLPHTMLGNNVAVIADRPDSMRPGVVVAESVPQAPATMAMGAGPSPTNAMGAGPAPAQVAPPQRGRSTTVVIEPRDPVRR
ncbi:MAG: hypothetical protein EOO24_47705 [Comamonadaceae bacterium]|nr:MAG: hypothetical protein EOO24_47705 [Comamonadaceae bacterium]